MAARGNERAELNNVMVRQVCQANTSWCVSGGDDGAAAAAA